MSSWSAPRRTNARTYTGSSLSACIIVACVTIFRRRSRPSRAGSDSARQNVARTPHLVAILECSVEVHQLGSRRSPVRKVDGGGRVALHRLCVLSYCAREVTRLEGFVAALPVTGQWFGGKNANVQSRYAAAGTAITAILSEARAYLKACRVAHFACAPSSGLTYASSSCRFKSDLAFLRRSRTSSLRWGCRVRVYVCVCVCGGGGGKLG